MSVLTTEFVLLKNIILGQCVTAEEREHARELRRAMTTRKPWAITWSNDSASTNSSSKRREIYIWVVVGMFDYALIYKSAAHVAF